MRPLLALAIALAFALPAAATSYSVNPEGSGDYPTIQAAIDVCADGDTVLCAPGTYAGTGNGHLDFGGVDLVLRSSDGSQATVLDGNWSYVAVNFHSGESRSAVIEGFTITHFGGGYFGNGIKCWDGSPTLRDLRLVENTSWGDDLPAPGAGLVCYGGSPLLEDVLFQGNVGASAAHFGDSSAAELRRVEFSGGNWGGLSLDAVPALLEDVRFIGCDYPVALDVFIADSLVLEGLTFRDNRRAIRASSGRLVMRDCLISDSQLGEADADRGVVDVTNADLLIENCTLARSASTSGLGAALSLHAPTAARIERSVIAHGTGVAGITWDGAGATPQLVCSDVFGHDGGDYAGAMTDPTGTDGNISEDPRFCGPINGLEYEFTVTGASPCLPANNDCAALMGALGEGCPAPTGLPDVAAPHVRLDAYPNPFNPTVTLSVELEAPAVCRLEIVTVDGRCLRTLQAGRLDEGHHTLLWDGRDAAGHALVSGVYLARLEAGGVVSQRKLVLLR